MGDEECYCGANGGEGCCCCTEDCPEDCMADHRGDPVTAHASEAAVEAGIAGVLAAHMLEVEHRAYPTFACSCEEWDGAMNDNGGPDDGTEDTSHGWRAHVAAALLASPEFAGMVAAAKGEAWDEAVRECHGLGWLHDWALSDGVARNPYRAASHGEGTSR